MLFIVSLVKNPLHPFCCIIMWWVTASFRLPSLPVPHLYGHTNESDWGYCYEGKEKASLGPCLQRDTEMNIVCLNLDHHFFFWKKFFVVDVCFMCYVSSHLIKLFIKSVIQYFMFSWTMLLLSLSHFANYHKSYCLYNNHTFYYI